MFNSQDSKPKGAKKSLNLEKGHERRQTNNMSIRTDKRVEMLEKKRRGGGTDETSIANEGNMDPLAFNNATNPAIIPVALLPQFANMVFSPDRDYAFHGTLMIRKLLSVESNPPIQEVVDTGVIPYFVEFLKMDDYPQLQFECVWALTNIASGTAAHANLVLDSGAVPHFVRLISSPSEDCREQATWAVGNIAGEGDKCRDVCLNSGAMPPLLNLIMTPGIRITTLRNAVWTLSNLCRSKPPPPLESVAIALPVVANLIHHTDDEVIIDATWAVSYISDGSNERVQAALDAQVLPRIVQLLSAPTTAMQTPAIRTIGNVVTGTDKQTQAIINAGALSAMHFLLGHQKRAIRKETCWALSNICAGQQDQIQAVINANLFPALLGCTRAPELEVKKEAVWAVANTASGGTAEQIRYLVEVKAIETLCELLEMFDPKIVVVALEALSNILQLGAEDKLLSNAARNHYADIVLECGGVELLERLQTHTNNDVYHHTVSILEAYFEIDGTDGAVNFAGQSESGWDFKPQGQTGGFNL